MDIRLENRDGKSGNGDVIGMAKYGIGGQSRE
jgi:hypothetical protein